MRTVEDIINEITEINKDPRVSYLLRELSETYEKEHSESIGRRESEIRSPQFD